MSLGKNAPDYAKVEEFKDKMGISGFFRTRSTPERRAQAVAIYDSIKDPESIDAMLDPLRKNSPNTAEYLQKKGYRAEISAKASKLPVIVDRLHPENDLSFTAGQVPYNGGKAKSKKSKSKSGGKARSRSRSKSRGKGKSKSKSRSRSRGKSRK